MRIEIKRTTVNISNVEVKNIKELNNLYSDGVIDELLSDYTQEIKYEYYLDGKKIKTDEI